MVVPSEMAVATGANSGSGRASEASRLVTNAKRQRIRNVVLNLENCILSHDRLSNTPSMQDGLDPELEADLRFVGCEMIQSAGILLRLPQVAMATGQVLYQRFYYSKSFVAHNFEVSPAIGIRKIRSKASRLYNEYNF